ncbi:triacylglycerol lipase [Coprinopsis cinerea okayama7|uniref:cutinase n=1 Tax=Coprinopsis cinerea (strain Okayama-7 / 130 / ATCC MYA-4618 / FGSC 9003) TaxID=240176 RepID=A8NB05_COPC7|nr:triacylglycerol lipase [Coprinopsis cinerea okayama7\|eukprot:XP_001832007.1 triacylglycerol lipase [Coprinopsis cinerea okayama7\
MRLSPLLPLITLASLTLATPVPIPNPIIEHDDLDIRDLLEARQVTCRSVHVLFARGTAETPTLGEVVGPGFRDNLIKVLPSSRTLSFAGISYAASYLGYLQGGDKEGAKTMATAAANIAKSCPSAKIFLSGYSQGAQVVHLAAAQLASSVQSRINGVITFGDPYVKRALPGAMENRRKTFCNDGDKICEGLPLVTDPHMNYKSSWDPAARWVAFRV